MENLFKLHWQWINYSWTFKTLYLDLKQLLLSTIQEYYPSCYVCIVVELEQDMQFISDFIIHL